MSGMKGFSVAAYVILVGTALICAPAKRIPTFAGPYRAVISKIVNESDDYKKVAGKFWIRLWSTPVRGKQPQFGWGHSYMSEILDDDFKVEVTMASRSNNQWKKNAFVMKFDKACSRSSIHALSLMRLIYGPDHDLTCPIKPIGLREIKNQTFELTFPKFPVIPYGHYQFTLAMIRDGEVKGVGTADCEVRPRL